MNRTPFLVGGLFVLIVGGGALWLGPKLLRRPARTQVPSADRDRATSTPGRDAPRVPSTSPMSTDRRPPARPVELGVTSPDGTRVPSDRLTFSGPIDERGLRGSFVRDRSSAWTRIAPTGADGRTQVRLAPAAPPLSIDVTEADGSPAAGVRLSYGPAGHASVVTDAQGHASIVDAEAGLLRVNVGAGARSAPPLRVRMGVDLAVRVALDPAWTIDVRVEDEASRPIVGARVVARGSEGRRAEPLTTTAEAVTRIRTRIDERLSLVVSADGRETTVVEVPPPDPRAPLSSAVTVVLPADRGSLSGEIVPPAGTDLVVRATVEPAVFAPLRDVLGREDVADASIEIGDGRIGRFEVRGLDPTIPWRLSLRGSVVPEDHTLRLSDPSARTLTLRPERAAAPPFASPEPDVPAGAVSLRGRVVDVLGAPLRGVTVGAEGRRAVTDADGLFVLPGLRAGTASDVVFGFVDGADPGTVRPADFSPWFSVRAVAGGELLTLVLPKAAGAKFRLTEGINGKPLAWARVVILDGDGAVHFDAPVATRDGVVVIEGLVPGAAGTLIALAPGLRREAPIRLNAGETVDAGEIGLVRAGRVTGTVKDKKGVAIVGAFVAAMEDGRLERGGRSTAYGRDLALRRATTDANGAFALEGLDTSRPTALGVFADGYAPGARRVLWNEGEDATVSPTLLRGGTVRLQVFGAARERVSGAFVELEDARSGVRTLDVLRRAALGSFVGSSEDVRRASSTFLLEDPATPGAYRIGPVESGPYEVIVSCAGFKTERARFTVPDVDSGAYRPIPLDVFDWRLELTPVSATK